MVDAGRLDHATQIGLDRSTRESESPVSKNADIVSAIAAVQTLGTTDIHHTKYPHAFDTLRSFCENIGLFLMEKSVFESLSDELRLYRSGKAPSPWPFELGVVVYPHGHNIEMHVRGYNFDGAFKVQCAYWNNGALVEGLFRPDELREPT